MNSMITKRRFFVLILLMLGVFSFAQNIRVIGNIPRPDTGKLYQLQIGAFRLAANANNACVTLTNNGFTPQFERTGDLVRVFVVVGAAEVRAAVNRLDRAGFREVIIREYSGACVPVEPAATETIPVEDFEPTMPPPDREICDFFPNGEFDTPEDEFDILEFDDYEEVFWEDITYEGFDGEDFDIEEYEELEEYMSLEEPEHDLVHIYEN